MTFISTQESTRLLLAVLLLLFSAQLFGYVFERLRMPKVIGEITGGLVLGPSLLGHVSPAAYDFVFKAYAFEGQALSVFYWFGLILLMFVSGLEQERWESTLDKKLIISLIVASTAVPILLGYITSGIVNIQALMGVKQSIPAVRMIFAISMAITSIPVISKIFMDIGIMHTRFAKTILSIAVTHDVLLWIGVAAATSMVSTKAAGEGLWQQAGHEILAVVLFFAVSIVILPKLTRKISETRMRSLARYSAVGAALLFCLLFVLAANLLGISAMFGALLAGLVLGISFSGRTEKIKENIKTFSMAFFVPVYFAMVGVQINLLKDFSLYYFAMMMVLSFVFQAAAVFPAALLLKKDRKLAGNIVISLTAKGGPGIVLATVTYEAGIINERFFTTLILAALATSLIAGWVLRRQKQEIENIL